jgi:hypothetical protein
MLEDLAAKGRLVRNIQRQTARTFSIVSSASVSCHVLHGHNLSRSDLSSSCRHACWGEQVQSTKLRASSDVSQCKLEADVRTLSFSPQTHAASSGAPVICGNSFLVGNLVQSGSHGMVVAVLFIVKKSVICVKR